MPGRYPGVHLLSQTSSCCFCQTLAVWGLVNGGGKSDTPGNGATLGDMKRWEDTSTPVGYEPFYCRLRAETGSRSRRRRGRATEMRSPQTTEARFSHSETETNLSVCKLPATGHAANPAEGQQPSSSGMEANSAPCVRGGLPGTAWRILGRHSADAAPGTPVPWCNQ